MPQPIIPEDILELSHARATSFCRVFEEETPLRKEVGQIWSTFSALALSDGRSFQTDDPRLVVILDAQGEWSDLGEPLVTAPISLRVEMASEWDMLISQDLSPVGFSFIAEVWNQTPVVPVHLRDFVGRLPKEAEEALQDLYVALLEDEEVPSSLEKWVGVPLSGEEDPRLSFQRAEIAAVAYLATAATAALELELAREVKGGTLPQVERQPLVFDLQPIYERLSKFMPKKKSQVAYAASGVGEQHTYLLHKADIQDDWYFTFELMNSTRSPYTVYVRVHELSPALQGSVCIITIVAGNKELRSGPTELQLDRSLPVGHDPHFRRDEVQTVTVEIL
jgi:hypothetical protein